MKLTDEERNSLVILQLEKAKVFLKQADEMFDLKYWDIASNRYYYACFHAVQALLIQNGLSCKTHDGLIACFGLNFIKTVHSFPIRRSSDLGRASCRERV